MLCDDDVKYCPLGRQIFERVVSFTMEGTLVKFQSY